MNILIMMETFAAVVEAGSFTAAAEQLGLSKSFVSKRISLLETELGTRLLYRTTRKLSLSDEGSRFYNHCRLIITEAENAKAEVIESQNKPQGKIRITLTQSLVISAVGEALLRFQQIYPDIELDIIASGRVENLVEKSIDVALRIGHLQDSTLKSRRITDCVFQVVASPDYIEKFGQYNQLYGSIGTVLVIMLFIWLNSIILLLGFELNASLLKLHHKNLEEKQ